MKLLATETTIREQLWLQLRTIRTIITIIWKQLETDGTAGDQDNHNRPGHPWFFRAFPHDHLDHLNTFWEDLGDPNDYMETTVDGTISECLNRPWCFHSILYDRPDCSNTFWDDPNDFMETRLKTDV